MKRKKSRIFGIVEVCLIVGLIVGSLILSVSAADFGDIVGEYRGVEARSNGQYTQTGTGEWQCVNYVDRFYEKAMGVVGAEDWRGHGYQYYGMAAERGLRAYENGSSAVAPRPDDILCFSGGDWGHVAIVTGIDDDYVHIIEQNWNKDYARERLPWNRVANTINKRGGCTVQGWLRLASTEVRSYPSGTLINSTSGETYQLNQGNKNPIPTDNVSKSWNLKEEHRITLSNKELAKYPEGPILIFREGTLLGNYATGERYVVEHKKKRLITSDEVFNQLGYDPANVIWLTNQEEIDLCPDGEPIYFQEGTVWHTRGTLIKSSAGNTYKVLGGQQKRRIHSGNVFDSRFGDWNRIIDLSELANCDTYQYTTVPPAINFQDGALILHGFDLYIIAEKEKRHIENEEIRDIMGYTWPPIEITEEEFNLHELGEPITKKNSVKYSTAYVPDDYQTIQEAVDNAEEGNTIIVRDGTYNENVVVSTSHLTIKSENGAEETIVQTTYQYLSVFVIAGNANYLNINGFTVKHENPAFVPVGGILIYANNCNVSNNIILSNENGAGIYLNTVTNNSIRNNSISGFWHGIQLYSSTDNNIKNNSIILNEGAGISLVESSDNNIINYNSVISNRLWSIHSYLSSNIIYLNNFIDNTRNVYSYDSTNTWSSAEQITYTHLGNTYTNHLGNYWDDYTDTDSNSDGIWDNPYSIDSDKDNYPLTQPFENYLPQESSTIEIKAFCPVNLSVVDPDGLTINIETNEIPEATYTETDINQDGDIDDRITIPDRKTGNYEITVIPELGAEPEDIFTLQVSSDETLFFLAENVSISDIPNNPYTIESNETGITDKTLINPEGGIGIAILPRINHITSNSTINFTIKIVSTENFDDIFHVYLTNESLPASWRADTEWFNWTSTNISIPSKEQAEIQLRAEIPIEASGNKAFRVIAESTRWTPVAFDTGILYIS